MAGKRTFLEEIIQDTIRVAERWINLSLEAKDILANPMGEAEEWVFFVTMVRALRVLRKSLIDILRCGRPRISGRITIFPKGQTMAEVFPRNQTEKLMFQGITGEVWMEPGVTDD